MDGFKQPKTRKDFNEVLVTGVFKVTFIKETTKEQRSLLVTLDPNILPKVLVTESNSSVKKRINESVVKCYDVEAKAWKSFRIDHLITMEKLS